MTLAAKAKKSIGSISESMSACRAKFHSISSRGLTGLSIYLVSPRLGGGLLRIPPSCLGSVSEQMRDSNHPIQFGVQQFLSLFYRVLAKRKPSLKRAPIHPTTFFNSSGVMMN